MNRGLPYRIAVLVLVGLAAVLAALAWSSLRTTADAEADVFARVTVADPGQLDQALVAAHARAQALFEDLPGGGDRVTLAAEPDGILLHVVGHDSDPATAARLANTAAQALVGADSEQFGVVALTDAAHATTSLVPGALRNAVPVALAAALSLGAALGLLAGRLPVRRAVGTPRA